MNEMEKQRREDNDGGDPFADDIEIEENESCIDSKNDSSDNDD